MKKLSMKDIKLREKLNLAFDNSTNPQEIISRGKKLGMEFSLEKAKEQAAIHKVLLEMRDEEDTIEKLTLTEYEIEEVRKKTIDLWAIGELLEDGKAAPSRRLQRHSP